MLRERSYPRKEKLEGEELTRRVLQARNPERGPSKRNLPKVKLRKETEGNVLMEAHSHSNGDKNSSLKNHGCSLSNIEEDGQE
jgi:hypothetical protein